MHDANLMREMYTKMLRFVASKRAPLSSFQITSCLAGSTAILEKKRLQREFALRWNRKTALRAPIAVMATA